MTLTDVLSPALATENRIRQPALSVRRIFKHDFYDVYLYLYPGLLTYLVHYKQESLRIMCGLWEDAPTEDRVKAALERLQKEGKSPQQLVRDAKLETGHKLTLHDRAMLKMAGVEIPRAAGRYRDLFSE
jgi:hypothetical protein